VHHRPAAPSLSARVVGALTRCALVMRVVVGAQTGRLVVVGVLGTVATGLVLAVPVISSSTETATVTGPTPFVLDPSAPRSSDTAPTGANDGSRVAGDVGGLPRGSVPPPAPATTDATTGATPDSSPAPKSAGAVTEAPTSTGTSGGAPAPADGTTDETQSSSPGTASSSSSEPEPAAESVPPTVASTTGSASSLFVLLDRARAEVGCDPLTADAALAAAAQEHSAAMRDEGHLDLPDGDDGPFLELGVSAAAVADGASADDVLDEWLDDDDDAAAIQNCDLVSVGIGTADGDDGPWWTLLLA